MASVFISYSRSDSAIVDRLDRELERSGYDVWVDRADIGGGSAWRSEIAQAIQQCDAFILVFSSRAAGSVNVSKELALADKYSKPIYPVVLEDHPVPESMEYQLAGLQLIHFTGTDFENGFGRLLNALPEPSGGRTRAVDWTGGPERRRSSRAGKRLAISAGLVIGIGVLVVGVIQLVPGDSGNSYIEDDPSLLDPALGEDPDFPPSGSLLQDVPGEKTFNDGPAAYEGLMREHLRQGVYSIEVPEHWLHYDYSTFNKTLERFASPAGDMWLDVEVGMLGLQPPDAVLGGYRLTWQTNGMSFYEERRDMEYDGWLVEGTLVNSMTGMNQYVYLMMDIQSGVNTNLSFYSGPNVEAEEREVIFADIRDTFRFLMDPY